MQEYISSICCEPHTKYWHQKIAFDAEAALQHLDQAQLTDDQRFALAVLAGVQFHWVRDPNAKHNDWIGRFETEPCSVRIVGGEVYIATKPIIKKYNTRTHSWQID